MGEGRLLAIDGMSILNRAYHALPPLTASDGTPTNAVYGFLLAFFKLYETYAPTHVAVAFDRPGGTFRHAQFAAYKAHRKEPDESLVRQFPLAEEVLTLMGMRVIGVPGFEADDVLGTLAARFGAATRVTLVSGDKDLLQLVGGGCEIVLMRALDRTRVYDAAAVKEDFGIEPRQVPDWKGLMGDPSDGIPGVPGIGEKTAVRLLAGGHSLDELLAHPERAPNDRIRGLLLAHRDAALFSRQLATIDCGVEIAWDLDDLVWQPGSVSQEARDRLLGLGFRQIVGRLPRVEQTLAEVRPALGSAVDLAAPVVALSPGEAAVGVASAAGHAIEIGWDDPRLRDILGRRVLLHGAKRAAHRLAAHGLELPADFFDTQLAGYLINPQYGTFEAREMLGALLRQAPAEGSAESAAAEAAWRLGTLLPEELARHGLGALYAEIEQPLVSVLFAMERRGVRIDQEELRRYGEELRLASEQIAAAIHAQAGYAFNINSTPQLRELLFEKLGLPVVKRTKTGPSTDAEVLEQLAPLHPVVQMILEHRQIGKLLGTYVDGLLPLVDPETSRIHTTFHQTLTATGRLSSADPNLQNIPVRMEMGRLLRRAFVPGEGLQLLAADYSQIELRILAHMSQDPALIDAFVAGDDIHRRTAAEVFGRRPEDVTEDERRQAKAVNFGIVYGISDFGLARDIGVSRQEAGAFIARYFARYPRVKDYLDASVEAAREVGYVTTLFGRRRFLPEIRSRNHQMRSFAERTAMNTPIQGTAADIIKIAMVRIAARLRARPSTAMLLQVHDELIFETPGTDLAEAGEVVRREMTGAAALRVPLVVEIKAGPNWCDVREIAADA